MLIDVLKECTLCPRKCKVNRIKNELGMCRAGKNIKIALSSLHFFEEPCISGLLGSGTIFFSGCNLRCCFCQNYKISQENNGKEISIDELADKFIKLQNANANNIIYLIATLSKTHIIANYAFGL